MPKDSPVMVAILSCKDAPRFGPSPKLGASPTCGLLAAVELEAPGSGPVQALRWLFPLLGSGESMWTLLLVVLYVLRLLCLLRALAFQYWTEWLQETTVPPPSAPPPGYVPRSHWPPTHAVTDSWRWDVSMFRTVVCSVSWANPSSWWADAWIAAGSLLNLSAASPSCLACVLYWTH